MTRWRAVLAVGITAVVVLGSLGPTQAQLFGPKATVTSPEGKTWRTCSPRRCSTPTGTSSSSGRHYDTGETAALIGADGFTSGALSPGEVKTLRATFKVPKGAKKVGITLSGIGTFDDVEIGQ